MAKKYRYCYELHSECIAMIKRKGDKCPQECHEVNNKVYVFTNIEGIEEDNCTLLYDTEYFYNLQNDQLIFDNVFEDMISRKVSVHELDLIKKHLEKKSVLVTYIENVSKPVIEEFLWRCRVEKTPIYNSHYEYNSQQYKREKIELHFSLLNQFEAKRLSFIFDLNKEEYGRNEVYSLLNTNRISLWELKILIEIIQIKLFQWNFIEEVLSSQYKQLFNRYRRKLSLWKTQQIFKKYRVEYQNLQKLLKVLEFFYDVFIEEGDGYENKADVSLFDKNNPYIAWDINQSKEEYEDSIYSWGMKEDKKRLELADNKKLPIFKLYDNYEKNYAYLKNMVFYSEFEKIYNDCLAGKDYHCWLDGHFDEGKKLIYEDYENWHTYPLPYDEWVEIFDLKSLEGYYDWYRKIIPF